MIDCTPLPVGFGARIDDLDVSEGIDPVIAANLCDLLRRFRLLWLPAQRISPQEQRHFAAAFGPVIDEPYEDGVSRVSNQPGGHLDTRGLAFHYDYSFVDQPLDGICLYAEQLPSAGSITSFVDGVTAANRLPGDLRAEVSHRYAHHVGDIRRAAPDSVLAHRDEPLGSDNPSTVRPILWPHPHTGELVLSVSQQATDHVVGMSRDESTRLLDRLFAVLYAPDNRYDHRWQPHDLLIWDNLGLQHGRPSVAGPEPRVLRRVTIGVDPAAARAAYRN